jgi:hypothetical protein
MSNRIVFIKSIENSTPSDFPVVCAEDETDEEIVAKIAELRPEYSGGHIVWEDDDQTRGYIERRSTAKGNA